MKRRKTRKLGSLSLLETQRLLGAGEPISVGKLPTDPLGMRMSAAILRERLVSKGGRPTDPAWTIVRKVPMRPETWAKLDRCAKELQQQSVRVSAGQIAAIALEKGLEAESKDENLVEVPVNSNFAPSQDAQARAHRARLALNHGALFQCG
jgi:hypothetical protein